MNKKQLSPIPELELLIDELPIPFRKMGIQKIVDDIPMEKRLFTEWSTQYNSQTYCLRSFKPISKVLSKIDPNVKSK